MKIRRYNDGKSLLERAQSWLLEAEAENSLMLGIAKALGDGPPGPDRQPYFATVDEGDEVIACALRTPPAKAILTRGTESAMKALADDLFAAFGSLPAVLGPLPEVNTFAVRWDERCGTRSRAGRGQRVFECRTVQPCESIGPGALRQAKESDLDLIVRWIIEFRKEVELGDCSNPEKRVREMILGGNLYLWQHRRPVSLAASSRRSVSGIMVNHVYTPQELRCKGYATSCVSALTQRLLDEGCAFCSLFTDISNPTSNSIYQKIGYRPVCDMMDVLFDAG
jgi:predicted GNAT family acetyltransferase